MKLLIAVIRFALDLVAVPPAPPCQPASITYYSTPPAPEER